MFTDSIEGNLEKLRALLAHMAPSKRETAKKAAASIENTILALKRDHPKDIAVALGVAFALFKIAEQLVQTKPPGGSEESLIQLLN